MAGNTQMLSNLVSIDRGSTPVIVNHYNVWPVFDVYANVAQRDLGGVGREVQRIMHAEEPHLPRGITLDLSQAEGLNIFHELIRRSDVLIENFKATSAEKLGLAPEKLLEINPRLVVCSISGFPPSLSVENR